MNTVMIREETPADAAAITALLHAAFPGPDEAALVAQLRADGALGVSLLAEQNGMVVGHVALSPIGMAGHDVRLAALAPLAVAAAQRGQGIARRLTLAAIDAARAQAVDALLVLGEPAIYGRYGFTPAPAGLRVGWAGPFFLALELRPAALRGVEGDLRYARAFDRFE